MVSEMYDSVCCGCKGVCLLKSPHTNYAKYVSNHNGKFGRLESGDDEEGSFLY